MVVVYNGSFAICSDSQAALKALSSHKVTSALVTETITALRELLHLLLLLLLVWQAPLGVRSAKCRHQSPEWTILSHSYRLIQ